MSAAERFVDALVNAGHNPRRNGAGWAARCPAHDDNSPSLSIGEGSDGRALVNCHAGCATEEVVAKLGLSMADLFTEKTTTGLGRIVAEYDYVDERGKLLFQVVRFDPKDFRQRRPTDTGWTWKLGRTRKVLYRLPEVIAAVADGERIWIAEGEKDVAALVNAGAVGATCNPSGSESWSKVADHARKILAGATIIVVADKDDAGRRWANEVEFSLREVAESVVIVEAVEGKDASDHLAAGHRLEDFLIVARDAGPSRVEVHDSDEHGQFELTDLGNARRLVAEHGHDLRHAPQLGKWLLWDGTCWAEDVTGEVQRRAKATVDAMLTEIATTESFEWRNQLTAHYARSQGAFRIRAMVDLASTEPGIPVTVRQLDADPWALNVANGTIDLRTGDLRPHDRDDMCMKIAPVDYAPDATSDLWQRHLDTVLPAPALRDFFANAVGYSITGSVREHKLFIPFGGGANGKTVSLEAIASVLGDYAQQAEPDLLLARRDVHPTGTARLRGARLVLGSESDERRRLAEGLVKRLTGGDTVTARYLYQDFFQFTPTHTLWLVTNHKPQVKGTDDGIWRRLRLVPFTVTIPADRQDRELPARLLEEASGILAWAVAGCLRWQAHGLQEPDDVRDATSEWRAESDVLAVFLSECTEDDDNALTPSAAIYTAYTTWCQSSGEEPMTQRDLGMRLSERGYDRMKHGRARHWHWIGIRLIPDEVNP